MAMDHTACTHPRTPAGRRACRLAAAAPVRDDRRPTKADTRAAIRATVPDPVATHDLRAARGQLVAKDARAALPFADRCGYVYCGVPRSEHVGGVSCLITDGRVKSNVREGGE